MLSRNLTAPVTRHAPSSTGVIRTLTLTLSLSSSSSARLRHATCRTQWFNVSARSQGYGSLGRKADTRATAGQGSAGAQPVPEIMGLAPRNRARTSTNDPTLPGAGQSQGVGGTVGHTRRASGDRLKLLTQHIPCEKACHVIPQMRRLSGL